MNRQSIASMNDQQVLWRINELQKIQMNCSPDSKEWKAASAILAPLFSEMAARQKIKAEKERRATA